MGKRSNPQSQEPVPTRGPELQYCNRDGYKLVMQGIASIVRVAQSDELKLVLEAGEWLVAYGEKLMAEKAALKREPVKAMDESRDRIIAELRGLYAKALPDAPLIVDTQAIDVEPEEQPAGRESKR